MKEVARLRTSLLGSFPNDVRNSFFSHGEGNPLSWIEFKRQPDADTLSRLEHHLQKFAEVFSLPSLRMASLGEADLPTKIEILSALRYLAPVNLQTLVTHLREQKLTVPSSDWANRRLDALRKGRMVLRRPDGTYVLTMGALEKLGTRKDRRSPDVSRVLALAQRRS